VALDHRLLEVEIDDLNGVVGSEQDSRGASTSMPAAMSPRTPGACDAARVAPSKSTAS
jgi:hypothetical protein